MAYTQDDNTFRLTTPLGKDVLLLRGIRGTEGVSELFDFELEAIASNDVKVSFDALLGQAVCVSVHLPDGSPVRWIHGLCSELEAGPRETDDETKKSFTSYKLRVVPKVWLLGLVHRSRVFQELDVPAILRKVLAGVSVEWKLEKSYDPREMCLQYRESDLAFAFRLMEEEGIRYFFRHSAGDHVLVVADGSSHDELPGPGPLYYDPLAGGLREEDRVTAWSKKQTLTRGKVTLRDRCFEMPTNDLEKVIVLKDSITVGTESHKLRLASADERELYGFPGGHAKPYDGVAPGGGETPDEIQKIFPYGEQRARVIMEREETRAVEVDGAGAVRHMAPGFKFTFEKHHDGNGAYLITRVRHDGRCGIYRSENEASRYANTFTCLPVEAVFRPARRTRRPVAQGPETAIVVGPQGEEIYVDKYGRIKVQFYWDREGKKDVLSCAWLRVATPLAGAQWGSYAFPRIGQEVLVAFQHGDPDEPVVVGALYNAENMPPYALPANMVRTGLKTRSTLRGGADEFHEVRLDDTKDKEEFFVQSQKDFHRLVKNNDLLQVGVKCGTKEPPDGSQRQEIWKNRTVSVGRGDDSLSVGRLPDGTTRGVERRDFLNPPQEPSKGGNQVVWVANDRTTTVATGVDKLVVGDPAHATAKSSPSLGCFHGCQVLEVLNDRTATVKNGNDKLTIEKGNLEVLLTGTAPDGTVTLTVPTSFELKVGTGLAAASLKIDGTKAELKFGTNVLTIDTMKAELKTTSSSLKLDATGASLKGTLANVEATGPATLKGAIANVQGSGIVNVTGGLIKIG